jgi:hypothetical protein
MSITVLAKDTKRGYVLLAGVGFAGVGTMWYPIEDHRKEYPGYDEAPEQDSTGGFGTPGGGLNIEEFKREAIANLAVAVHTGSFRYGKGG